MWKYRKPEPTDVRGLCVVCETNQQKKTSRGTYQALCSSCDTKRYNTTYTAHKGPVCESCGFEPEHPCQLDVDHIDGNHSNNDVENLQTLCANCHRLKTYRQLWTPGS